MISNARCNRRRHEPEKNKINCPECGKKIDVNEVWYDQVSHQLKKEYDDNLNKEKEKYIKNHQN